jgi:thymidylate kinase
MGSSISDSKTKLLKYLIYHFNSVKFCYCIVGNTQNFPKVIDSDIDIIIPQVDINKVLKLLHKFCLQNDLKFVQTLQHENNAFYNILVAANDKEKVFIHPDICGDYYRNGRLLISSSKLMENRQQVFFGEDENEFFYIPSPANAFIYYLVKKIDKLSLSNAHGKYLSDQWHLDPDGCRKLAGEYWEGENLEIICNAAATNQWSDVQSKLSILQKQLRKKHSLSITSLYKELKRIMVRVTNPTGLFVVFLGPDGSGKTTVIERIQTSLAPAFRRVSYGHFRPQLGLNCSKNGTVDNPHARPPRGVIASGLKLIYYALDYIFGYWLKIKPALIRSTLVIYDRYYTDLMVDPKRFRLKVPKFLLKSLGLLIPKPDLIILLDAPAEVIYQRKQEVEFDEIKRQQQAYKEMVLKIENSVIIDVSKSIDEVVNEVENTIIEFLQKRQNYRLKI